MSDTMTLTNNILKEIMTDTMLRRGGAADVNTLTSYGIWSLGSTTLNLPPGFTNGIIEVIPRTSTEIFQRITAWQGIKQAIRTGTASDWGVWRIYEPSSQA